MNIQDGVQDITHNPKLLTHLDIALLLYFWLIWAIIFYNQTLHHSLQVGMFLIIVSISATGLFGYLEVYLGIIIGSYWIMLNLVKVFCIWRLALVID